MRATPYPLLLTLLALLAAKPQEVVCRSRSSLPSEARDSSLLQRNADRVRAAAGGSRRAWQTLPQVQNEHLGGASRNPTWHASRAFRQGVVQSFQSSGPVQSLLSAGAKPAEWFDSAVNQYDAFGRPRLPTILSDKRFAEWAQRTVSTTLACAEPGCVANGSLQVINLTKEEFAHCLLYIGIHATDFDDDFSRENVEWWTVNDFTVNTFCNPKARGCQAEAQRMLHPCVEDVPIDHIIDSHGKVQVAGKLSPMVDECPVDGNFLSGVVSVTCMVRAKLPPPVTTDAESHGLSPGSLYQPRVAHLRCAEPGCIANGTLLFGEADMQPNRTCRLTVRIAQTDFDSHWETVEWVKLGNRTIAQDLRPGRNPCKEAAAAAESRGQPDPTNWTHFNNAKASATRAAADSPGNDSAALELGAAQILRDAILGSTAKPTTAPSNTSAGVSPERQADTGGFVLVDSQDVTSERMAGRLPLSVKISDMVDECGSGGNMLSAEAVVVCE